MNQQPDKFFRDKLESYQPSAPTSAWDRIEAGLEKKTDSKKWWIRIAASLLLLATAAIVLWPGDSSDPIAHGHSTPTPKDSLQHHVVVSKASDDVSSAPMMVKKELQDNTPSGKHEDHHSTAFRKNVEPVETNNINVAMTAGEKEKRSEDAIASAQEAPQPVENTTPIVAKNENSVKIIITADESSKYLKKDFGAEKNVVAQATSEEKKTSTFKKLLEKAEDLTTNQDPLGDVRQMKDEILALNFKNEKRGQNK